MTRERRSVVGWPGVRHAYQLLLLLAVGLLMGSVAVGASLIVLEDRPRAGSNGSIAVSVEGDILLAGPDGSHARSIGDGRADESGPTFSPDGERLAFWSTTQDGLARLFVMEPDGDQQRQFEPGPGWLFVPGMPRSSSNISWSPDSERIATLVEGERERAIGMIDLVSGLSGTLDIDALEVDSVTWSPDGQWLAYVGGWVDGAGPSIRRVHLIRPDGSADRRLTPLAPGLDGLWSVDWSPDSHRLTYGRLRPDGTGPDIYAVDLATGAQTLIAGAPSAVSFWMPRFSPDGSAIAASGAENGEPAVYVMPADGQGEAQRLAIPEPINGDQVTWAPDGGSILVGSRDHATLFIVPLDDPRRTIGIPIGRSGGPRVPSWQRAPR